MGGSHLHKATCFVNTQEPCVHTPLATSYMRKMWLQREEKPARLKPDWGKQETLVRGHCWISPWLEMQSHLFTRMVLPLQLCATLGIRTNPIGFVPHPHIPTASSSDPCQSQYRGRGGQAVQRMVPS